MAEKDIAARVIQLVSGMTDAEEVTRESELIEDLDISSMDVLTMMASLEEEFKIRVPEKMIRKMTTVEDIIQIVENLINK